MCGLVGVVGRGDAKVDRFFKILLQLDVIRGEHSTGVCLVDFMGDANIYKQVGTPAELYDSVAYNKQLFGQNVVMLGHNRYATKGAINKINAHPFEHDGIFGAHNGTIFTQYKLLNPEKFVVDSENIMYNIANMGIQDTTPLLGGAYALTWWDSKDNTINLVRNNERPLFYSYSKDRMNFFWASERWMLEVASAKTGIELGNIINLVVGKHVRLQVPLARTAQYPMLGALQIEEVVQYVAPKPKKRTKKSRATKIGGDTKTTKKTASFSANLIGKTVDFTVVGQHKYLKHCINAKLTRFDGVECRFNIKKGSDKYNQYLTDTGVLYQAVIKRTTQTDRTVIILDTKSIEEVTFEDMQEPTPPEVNGKVVSDAEYLMMTADGCCICKDKPLLIDSPDLFWVNPDAHVCLDCMESADPNSVLRNTYKNHK